MKVAIGPQSLKQKFNEKTTSPLLPLVLLLNLQHWD